MGLSSGAWQSRWAIFALLSVLVLFVSFVVMPNWQPVHAQEGAAEGGATDQGSFADWLRGIAANLLRNRLRKRRSAPSLNGQPAALARAQSSGSDDRRERDQAEQIAHALSRLPERYEAALRAKYLDQQSVAQMADAWSESPKAVESLLARAREAFRQEYQRLES